MISIILNICFIYILGCGRLIHGGSHSLLYKYFTIKEGKDEPGLPFSRVVAPILATIGFSSIVLFYMLPLWLILAFPIGWIILFSKGHHAYFDIGSSYSPARPSVDFIDYILLKIWKRGPDARPGTFYSFIRDLTGMFLRQCFALPLLLTLSITLHGLTNGLIYGILGTIIFSLMSILCYAVLNWFWPSKWKGDYSKIPNIAEIGTGMALGLVICLIVS